MASQALRACQDPEATCDGIEYAYIARAKDVALEIEILNGESEAPTLKVVAASASSPGRTCWLSPAMAGVAGESGVVGHSLETEPAGPGKCDWT